MKGLQCKDERLYQEIIRKLDKSAAEYDRLMACGEAPAKRRKTTAMRWYAAAASVASLLIASTMLLVGHLDKDTQYTAGVKPANNERLTDAEGIVEQTVNADSDLYRLTAKPAKQYVVSLAPYQSIYTATLPEVEFWPEGDAVGNNDVCLPQVSKERSFNLVCKVMLPEVTAYADSTTIMFSTEMTVACNEINYND